MACLGTDSVTCDHLVPATRPFTLLCLVRHVMIAVSLGGTKLADGNAASQHPNDHRLETAAERRRRAERFIEGDSNELVIRGLNKQYNETKHP